MLTHEQEGCRLADHIRSTDDDHALARDLDPRTLEDLDRSLGRCRQEAVVAEREQAGIAGVDAVDVLRRVDRIDHCPQRDVSWERHLDDDARHGRIRVETLDLVADCVGSYVRSDPDKPPEYAHLLAGPQDLLQIHGRRCVRADEDDSQCR